MLREYILVCKKDFVNKAPIGAYVNKDRVKIYLYEGSHTYNILKEENYFSLNVVEPLDLVRAILEDEDEYLFYKNIPFLKNSFYSIFYEVVERKEIIKKDNFGESKLLIIKAKELDRVYMNKIPKPYNRGESLLVELAIIYSRLIKYESEELKEKAIELYKEIKRVGSKESKILADKLIKILSGVEG